MWEQRFFTLIVRSSVIRSGDELVHEGIQLDSTSIKPQIIARKVWGEYQIVVSRKVSVRHLRFQERKLELVIMFCDIEFHNFDGHTVWLLLNFPDLLKNVILCLKNINLPILRGTIVIGIFWVFIELHFKYVVFEKCFGIISNCLDIGNYGESVEEILAFGLTEAF